MSKRISILGATGSIGCSTIDLIARQRDEFEVVALTGGRNIAKLAEQARALSCEIAVTAQEDGLEELRARLEGSGIAAAAGRAALLEAAGRPADWVMSGIVGIAGLEPGLEALKSGGTLALANKESLVCAGPLLLSEAARLGATVLPVDSEHSAIFQALVGEDITSVERVIITASGGAFRDWPLDRLADATPTEAAAHPNWDMGQRITIDSATLFNKAMEVIEAHEFFGFTAEQIEVVIHPESLIHALIGFNDGALMAHVGPPDMRHAIGFALNWPERRALPVERLDLVGAGSFTFRAPDEARHPALRLARGVMREGGLAGTVFNAGKEAALDAFIGEKIGFPDMAALVERVMEACLSDGAGGMEVTLDNVRAMDAEARRVAANVVPELART